MELIKMVTLNFFDTFSRELINFIKDIKNVFIDIFNAIHHFLNRFFGDEFLLMLLIAIVAIIVIFMFRSFINHD